MHWIDARDALKLPPALGKDRTPFWPKAFLQTNVFLMRDLIRLVKSIVLMGRIYRMDSFLVEAAAVTQALTNFPT